ncbi:MAG: cobalamin-dependent protein [Acidobacteriota bacterium]|nr:cobalamin-dependent protein [Acidobacteriota bacterium]
MTAITTTVTTGQAAPARHPRGSRASVLLTSVFGPYAQDDEYGSRTINPMELYHNQVTRVQGAFSLRMFHRSWGLMLIQANIEAPCTLLDFPTLDRFIEEIKTHDYDIVGIGAIIPNVAKVQKMCELVRIHLPQATIVVGGHVANIPDIAERIDADHIVRGEGVAWMRRFLGEDDRKPLRHPRIVSGMGTRVMGVRLREKPGDVAATVIPSVGCPLGCNFCATSAMFGGKGKFVHFYESGDELFEIMHALEQSMKVRSFFMMDENFLFHRKRALRLLELMIKHDKPWALYVFSSANVLRKYTLEQLVQLGISWIWMGLEGKAANYSKLNGIDTRDVVRQLQAHGIRVLGSTIIGLEEHRPETMHEVISHAVSHDTEFHQFMLYTPVLGTPLHAEFEAKDRLLDSKEFPECDTHGQYRFSFRHPHFRNGEEGDFLLKAFRTDLEVNGPSIVRVARTLLQGWQRHKNHPDLRVRRRFLWEIRDLATTYAGALWAARRRFRSNPTVSEKISRVLRDLYREFGIKSRLAAPLLGRYLQFTIGREERRLERGWTYEPATFRETEALFVSPAGKSDRQMMAPAHP